MSFRARLVLAAGYLLAAVVIALAVPLGLNVDRRVESELESDVLANTAVLAARVSELVARGNTRPAEVGGRLEELAAATVSEGWRTLVVDGQGRVLADSAGAAAPGEVYATPQRPELGAALSGGVVDVRERASETVGEPLLLVTVPVADDGAVVGAVRVSAPLGEVEAAVRASWLRIALIGLAVVAAGLGLAWILAGSLAAPVEKLRAAAGRLGRGDLDARPRLGSPPAAA